MMRIDLLDLDCVYQQKTKLVREFGYDYCGENRANQLQINLRLKHAIIYNVHRIEYICAVNAMRRRG